MKMYKVSLLGKPEITEYETVRTTEKSVWFKSISPYNGKVTTERELKSTEYFNWFDTHSEAVDYVVARLTVKIDSAKLALKLAEKTLREFES